MLPDSYAAAHARGAGREIAIIIGPAKALAGDWPPMQRYWANFIRNGDPNGADLPAWPVTTQRDGSLAIAPHGVKAVYGARAHL